MHRGALADLCTGRSDTLTIPHGVTSADLDAAGLVPHADVLTGAHIHIGRDADSHRDSTQRGQRHLHFHGDAHNDVHTLCYPYLHKDTDTDEYLHPHSNTLIHSHPYGDMDTESDPQPHAEPAARQLANTAVPAERSMMLARGDGTRKQLPSSCCRRDT